MEEFSFETFEGPTSNGGFDNDWVGFWFLAHTAKAVSDPNPPSNNAENHVLSFTQRNQGQFFSKKFTITNVGGNTVVKFRYYIPTSWSGAWIGMSNNIYVSIAFVNNITHLFSLVFITKESLMERRGPWQTKIAIGCFMMHYLTFTAKRMICTQMDHG